MKTEAKPRFLVILASLFSYSAQSQPTDYCAVFDRWTNDKSNSIENIAPILERLSKDSLELDLAKSKIEDLINNTRKTQDSIFYGSGCVSERVSERLKKAIGKNKENGTEADHIAALINTLELVTTLKKASFDSRIFDDRNLSRISFERWSTIVNSTKSLENDDVDLTGASFKQIQNDLNNFGLKFINAKRFSIGLGYASNFMPTISYYGKIVQDYSFIATTAGNTKPGEVNTTPSHTQYYNIRWENDVFSGFFLKTQFSPFSIQFNFPSESRETRRDAWTRVVTLTNDEDHALLRNKIASKFKLQYSLDLKMSLKKYLKNENRFDIGVGIGLKNIELKDVQTAEIGRVNSETQAFDDIPVEDLKTVKTVHRRSVNVPHVTFYSDVRISDSWELSLNWYYYNYSESISYEYERIGDEKIKLYGHGVSLGTTYFFR